MEIFKLLAPALVGVISAVLTSIVGGFYLSRIKENKAKRMEISIKRADDQIALFYAPLMTLVEQLSTIANLKDSLVIHDPANESPISEFMYDEYFLPIHKKIALIIEQHMNLLEGKEIPQSFIEYNEHVASERVFFSMIKNKEIKINFSPHPFPGQFYWDIRNGFENAVERQEFLLGILDKAIIDEDKISPNFKGFASAAIGNSHREAS